MHIRFVDTFAGIGGFHIGVKKACSELGLTCECVKSVEFDPNACETYEKNFGIDPQGDMNQTKDGGAKLFPDHDILLGGFPCQPFSRNGKYYNKNDRKVAEDEDRALLCHRLFEILEAKQPKFFVFENVKEIATIENHDGSSVLETIIANLKSLGYLVEKEIMDSRDFGLPQQRKRMYFVGVRKDLDLYYKFPKPIPLTTSVEDILEKKVSDKYLLKNLWRNRKIGQEEWSVLEGIGKIREIKGESKYADKLEQVWQQKTNGSWDPDASVSRLEALEIAYNSGEWDIPKEKTRSIHPVAIIYGDTPSGLPRQQDKLYSTKGVSPTIATFSTPNFDIPSGWRMLTPRECARLQGFPDDFVLPTRDSVAYKQVGNAVSTNTAAAVIKSLFAMVNDYPW